jgi:hypothetical protein
MMSSFKFEFNLTSNINHNEKEDLNNNNNNNNDDDDGDDDNVDEKDENNTSCQNIQQQLRVDDGTTRTNKKMPLSTIQIGHLLKLLRNNHRKRWNTCDVKLIDTTSTSTTHFEHIHTLKRIIHTDKPFHNDDDNDNIGISLMVQKNKTDIIPGKYEGGLKVWECSIDLCNFLSECIHHIHRCNDGKNDKNGVIIKAIYNVLYQGGSIVELGCGHALPGCLMLKEIVNVMQRGNQSNRTNVNNKNKDEPSLPFALFTDYNSFVLRDVTLPNIILNCINENIINEDDEVQIKLLESITQLIAGDWMELSTHLQQQKYDFTTSTTSSMQRNKSRFDLILASETTYTLSASKDTAYWLYHHLKYDTGIGLVSMKRYYFGVGGSTDVFKEAASSYGLMVKLIREYNDGSSNIRDLLLVTLPSRNQKQSSKSIPMP